MANTTERVSVGTIVGLSDPNEFIMAAKPGAVRLQNIVAVDAHGEDTGAGHPIRVWAKVKRIERLNPLFPVEAGHELAQEGISAMDTVLSVSREMVTAYCQIIGYEEVREEDAGVGNKLSPLRYPVKPTASVYTPGAEEIKRILSGGVPDHRALRIGTLAGRDDVGIALDGNPVVGRHLAILAMTGAGKTVACRTILEELIAKEYPILIFDPHGDYVGFRDTFGDWVTIYRPYIHMASDNVEEMLRFVNDVSGFPLSTAMEPTFEQAYLLICNPGCRKHLEEVADVYQAFMSEELYTRSKSTGQPNFWAIKTLLEAIDRLVSELPGGDLRSRFEAAVPQTLLKASNRGNVVTRLIKVGNHVNAMERMNQQIAARYNQPMENLPEDRTQMIGKSRVSIVCLGGYDQVIQTSIVASVLDDLFEKRVTKKIKMPFLVVLEEAHNFIPASGERGAAVSVATIKRIVTEGRKFGVGLIMISQRPSRLDSTALSQCNSFIIMRMVNPTDQSFVRSVVETLAEDDARILPNLMVGEALVSGQCVRFPVMVRVRESETRSTYEEEDFLAEVAKA
jgi:Cdc6-like AAA superfamily ATPase